MTEQDMRFQGDGLTLSGTLSLPAGDGPFPAALLVVGSGEVDRNENHARMAMNVYNELAARLAEAGFASLRFDKRGIGASEGSFPETGFFDNVADATAALTALCDRQEVDDRRVVVIGHSEGALIATRMAATGAPVAGVGLLAGTAQSGGSVLEWQGREVVKHLKGFQGWLVRTLRIDPAKTQRKLFRKIQASDKAVMRVQLVVKLNAKWMREFISYDTADDLPKITVPVLAITGGHDIQVDPHDIERMRELVTAPFEGHIIPELSHILRRGAPGTSDYKRQAAETLDGELISIVEGWMRRL
ncbi:MAG: alpha/beta fold hydrolase [Spirochaetaceae bacterium]|nr:MAG: alpha/beta fold hydrolase [Spirochaetaceae bacterium]